MTLNSFGVIGGGAWGTALAQTLRLAGRDVVLWAREAETVADINARHVNRTFLPGVALDPDLKASAVLKELSTADVLVMVAPAQHVRSICKLLKPHLKPNHPVVLCAKGLEQASGQMMSDIIETELPEATLAVLSGPSFAADVARGMPAALTLACRNEQLGRQLAERIGYKHFRLYWSNDITGVELGGAIKNVLAIAAGIVDGKGLGASAHAALVTRGFAELRRCGAALGAKPETMMGLSGLGDLILTCGSPQSRNMSLGRALGQGRKLDEILGERVAVTEGVHTAAAVVKRARELHIEMPISEAVNAILEGRASVDDAISALMQRPFKAED